METMNRDTETQLSESDEEIGNNASVEDTKVETHELTAEEVEILKTISSKHTDSTSSSLFWHIESGSDSPTSILVWPHNMKIMRKAVNRLKKLSVEQLNKKHVLLIEREKKLQLQILRARLELIHVYKTCDEHLGISSQNNRDSKKRKRKTSNTEKKDGEEKEKKKKARVSSKNSKSDEEGKDCSETDLKKKETQIGKKRQRVEEGGNEAREAEGGEVTNVSDTKLEKKIKGSKSSAPKGPSSNSGKNSLKKNGKAAPPSNNYSAKKGKSSSCVEKKAVHTRFDEDSDDSSDDGTTMSNGNQGKDAVDFDNLDDSLDSEEDD